MRLRLRIERNELPAVSVLWAIGDTELRQTVSQFLERVNERFPLEGESWGLEDYAVTVGGYEALHYTEVGTSFQNEDELVIKPLQFVDVKARTITGRAQISGDGRHLLDGIPFGRPMLKRPQRPDIHIPPRKRPRLEGRGAIENGEAQEDALVRFQELDEDEDSEDEDDLDFDEAAGEFDDSEEDSENDSDDESDKEPPKRRRTRNQLLDREAEADSDDQSSEEDSDSDSEDDESSDSSSEDSSDTSDSDEDTASQVSWNGIESNDLASSPRARKQGPNAPSVKAKNLPNGIPSTNGTPNKSGDSALRKQESAPGEGADKTKARNLRRREQRKLGHLKEAGLLPPGATLKDLEGLIGARSLHTPAAIREAASNHKLELERQKLLNKIASGGVEVPSESNRAAKESAVVNGDDEDDGPPEEEPTAPRVPPRVVFNEMEVATETDGQIASASDRSTAKPIVKTTLVGTDQDEMGEAEAGLNQRRKRLDLAGTNRLVFGSLGVRAPKTQAEKDVLQQRLLTRATKQSVFTSAVEEPQAPAEDDEDPDAWRSKIEISAVECCDEGVTLSEPPFPFEQRWDPQYRGKNRKGAASNASGRRKKRKANGAANDEYVETYDKYNTNGGGDFLNYDDPEDLADSDSYWEDGALLNEEDDGGPEAHSSKQDDVDDGFPKLPQDITILPELLEAEAQKGDFVVYNELSCSAATSWEPKMLIRTVRLDEHEGQSWTVTFAQRDVRPKQFDEEGNRIYTKFEMEGLSEDEDEEAVKSLQWSEMQQPRLLQRAEQ